MPPGIIQPLQQSSFEWPSLLEISTCQAAYFATTEKDSTLTLNDGLYLTELGQIFVPPTASQLKLRILIIAHCGLSGHCGIQATLTNIRSRFYWQGMSEDAATFGRQCLHCSVNRGGQVIPRPFGTAVHAKNRNSVLHFDYLSIDLSRQKQFKYLFVIRDDLSSFTELFPCLNPNAVFAAECLFDWISRYGIPSTFVSDRGSHFLNSLIEELCLKLHIRHHFTLAYCPWSNGTIEVVNGRILHVLRSLLSELRLEPMDWPILIPLVRFALNHAVPPDRPAAVTLFCGLPSSSPLDSIWNPKHQSLISIPLDSEQLFNLVEDLRQSLLQWHKHVEERRDVRRHAANSRRKYAKIPNFTLGDFFFGF